MDPKVYFAKRILLLFLVLMGTTFLVFSIAILIPKDPAYLWAGGSQNITEEQLEAIRIAYHLRDPWYMQYFWYLRKILQGDFGVSPVKHVPVSMELSAYLPQSIELGVFALALSIVIGIPIGVVSATRKESLLDHIFRVLMLANVSIPLFWIGLVFQMVFYYHLGWFPEPGGNISQELLFTYPLQKITGFNMLDALITGNLPVLRSLLEHLAMPGLIMSFMPTAMIARITRASMLEVVSQDYIRTARAYGLRERVVIYKLALRNALIPSVTTIGLAVGWLLTGSVVVETIFYWPGIGRYASEAIQNVDFPALMGVTMVSSLLFASANLLVDLSYALIDPRMRG